MVIPNRCYFFPGSVARRSSCPRSLALHLVFSFTNFPFPSLITVPPFTSLQLSPLFRAILYIIFFQPHLACYMRLLPYLSSPYQQLSLPLSSSARICLSLFLSRLPSIRVLPLQLRLSTILCYYSLTLRPFPIFFHIDSLQLPQTLLYIFFILPPEHQFLH